MHVLRERSPILILRLGVCGAIAVVAGMIGVSAVAQDLAIVEFDLYPSIFEPADICEVIPTWLLDQMSEYSTYQCSPAILTREELRCKRIIGEDLALTTDSINKLFRNEGYELLVIGSITGVPVIGSMTVTASLVGDDGVILESGTVTASTLGEAQSQMRDLCFALLGMEAPSGNAPPIAKINIEASISESLAGATEVTVFRNESVLLDASSSYDIDGEVARYEWDLDGDGDIDEYNATTTCDTLTRIPGRHPVFLTVVDSFGASATAIVWISVIEDDVQEAALVSNIRPQPDFTVFGEDGKRLDRPAYIGEELTLDASASFDPDGEIVAFSWDLNGDAVPDDIAKVITTRRLAEIAGEVIIQLSVTDDLGVTSSMEYAVEVSSLTIEEMPLISNIRPQPDFTVFGEDGKRLDRPAYIGEELTLDASASFDPDGEIVAFSWDLNGDAVPDDIAKVITTRRLAEIAGEVIIQLSVTDDLGVTSSMEYAVEVSETTADEHSYSQNLAPVVYIEIQRDSALQRVTGSPYIVFLGEAIQLRGSTSYDPDGQIVAWQWTTIGEASVVGYRSSLSMPALTAMPGQQEITLEVTDEDGARTSKSIALTVLDYTAERIVQNYVDDTVLPALRKTFMVLMGLGLIAGVGFLIWYYGG